MAAKNDKCIRAPFTGREKEMEQLMDIMKDAMLQEGTLVLISGEAGIGKTRLVEEFESKAAQVDCITLIGHCMPGVAYPFLPFIEAFRNYFKTPSVISSERTEEVLFGRIDSSQDKSWSKDRILFSTLEFLRRKSAIKPIIIHLEDLQWADTASIQLLHFLARNTAGMKIMLIGTYRPEDLVPDSSGNAHPLVDSLRIMRREGIFQLIELGDLMSIDVQEIVNGLLGGRLESKVLNKVIEESEGNPLYAIESTKLLALSESIEFINGEWRAAGLLEIVIPPTIKEVIQRRLERLPKPQRRLLEYASAVGRVFDIDILGEVTHKGKMDLLENLEMIETEGKLICQADQGFHFSHEMIRQVTYDSISQQRRKEIHRLIGEALECSNREDIVPALLAMHFKICGDRARSVKYTLSAGESLVVKGAAIEAIPYLNQAIQFAGKDNQYSSERIRAYNSLGCAYLLLGKLDSASNYLEQAISETGIENANFGTLISLYECWSGVALGKGDQTRGLVYLAMAEKAAIGDYEKGKIAATRANNDLWSGDFQKAESNFRTAIDTMTRVNDVDEVVKCKAYLSDVYLTQGKVQEAFDEAQDALEIARTITGFYGELEASFYAGLVHLHIGNISQAIDLLRRSVEIAQKIGESSAVCWGNTYLSLAFEMLGNNEVALQYAKKSYENAIMTESPLIMLNGISGFLHSCVRMGMRQDAFHLNEEASKLEMDFKWGMHSTTRCLLIIAMAEYHASREEWELCDKLFVRAFELLKGTPVGLLLEGLGRSWYAQILASRGEIGGAKRQMQIASSIFLGLHNQYQVERISSLITRLDT